MTFQYISTASTPILSSVRTIWLDNVNNKYFISSEGRNYTIVSNTEQQFMLNYKPISQTIYHNYKDKIDLQHSKQLTNEEINHRSFFYNGHLWTF